MSLSLRLFLVPPEHRGPVSVYFSSPPLKHALSWGHLDSFTAILARGSVDSRWTFKSFCTRNPARARKTFRTLGIESQKINPKKVLIVQKLKESSQLTEGPLVPEAPGVPGLPFRPWNNQTSVASQHKWKTIPIFPNISPPYLNTFGSFQPQLSFWSRMTLKLSVLLDLKHLFVCKEFPMSQRGCLQDGLGCQLHLWVQPHQFDPEKSHFVLLYNIFKSKKGQSKT